MHTHTHTSHVVPGQRTLIRQGHAGTTTYRVRVSRWLVVFLAASATMPSLSIMGRSERTVCTHKWSCDAASQTSNTVCMSKLGGHILFRSKYARPRKNCHAASPHTERPTACVATHVREGHSQSERHEQSRAGPNYVNRDTTAGFTLQAKKRHIRGPQKRTEGPQKRHLLATRPLR